MTTCVVVGSGPAAVGVVLALLAAGRTEVTILDVGATLELEHREMLERLGTTPPIDWPAEARDVLARQPLAPAKGQLPQKRIFGSDFPFRDLGQLRGLSAAPGGNSLAVSGAFGGFSNAWGAQVLPFTKSTIDEWPISYDELVPHYEAILRQIPFAGRDDDYSELFPLIATPADLPDLSSGVSAALARYEARHARVRGAGVTVGAARLAMNARRCTECGLCLTGCPTGLIYSAGHTLAKLVDERRIKYRDKILVTGVGEDSDGPWINARRIDGSERSTVRADLVFIAGGGIGSTRLVLSASRPEVRRLYMAESVQFVLPFLSRRAYPDPRRYSTFTLNQLSMIVEYGRAGLDLAHLHLYPYNPAFDDMLPSLIRRLPGAKTAILRRTTAALGYLPSWVSPRLTLDVGPRRAHELPEVNISSRANPATLPTLANVMMRLLRISPALDLWPALPVLRISGPGKSYHFGGSFPHVHGRPAPGALETDTLGRLAEWRRVHLVDGAVFPTVPATTFTLSVMANAHRIASEVAQAA